MLVSRVEYSISIILAILLCYNVNSYVIINSGIIDENATPIVGILTQEVSKGTAEKYPGRNLSSYIAASYIKFVEGAGARAVPIWIDQSPEYYKDILSKVNGVLLPGGASSFKKLRGYAQAGYYILNETIELNKKGIYFPLWGTCLGYELIMYLEANRTDFRSLCSSNDQPLPLEFVEGFKSSRMFSDAPEDIISILKNKNVTANYHKFCVTRETFKKYGLDKDWKILSINHDWNNFEFISTIEHKDYPIYGVQFHPEKSLYEFPPNRSIPHSMEAVRAAHFFADFFVTETRKNMNKFTDPEEEENSLIYNYSPEYTGKKGSLFMQQYMFNSTEIQPEGDVQSKANLCTNSNEIIITICNRLKLK